MLFMICALFRLLLLGLGFHWRSFFRSFFFGGFFLLDGPSLSLPLPLSLSRVAMDGWSIPRRNVTGRGSSRGHARFYKSGNEI